MVTPYGRSVMAKRGRHGPLGLALAEPVHDVDDLLHVESLHGCLRTVVTVRKLRRWQRTQTARWYIPSRAAGTERPAPPGTYRAAQVVHTGRRTLVQSPQRSLVQYSPVRDMLASNLSRRRRSKSSCESLLCVAIALTCRTTSPGRGRQSPDEPAIRIAGGKVRGRTLRLCAVDGSLDRASECPVPKMSEQQRQYLLTIPFPRL